MIQNKCGVDINAVDEDHNTSLHRVALNGCYKIVELLLKYKCDPNISNNKGETALYIASVNGHSDIVELLLQSNSNPDICNKENETPLSMNVIYVLLNHC